MHTDTYRYLLSALMQVFGALVAIDAVFLTFQQQNLSTQRSKLLFQLGRYISMCLKHGRFLNDFDPNVLHHNIDRDADAFEAFSKEEIGKRIAEAEKWISEQKTRLEKAVAERTPGFDLSAAENNLIAIKNQSPHFQYFVTQYRKLERKQSEMPILLAQTMGVPSALVIIFGVLLFPAGIMSECANAILGAISLLLAAAGLVFLVKKAKEIIS